MSQLPGLNSPEGSKVIDNLIVLVNNPAFSIDSKIVPKIKPWRRGSLISTDVLIDSILKSGTARGVGVTLEYRRCSFDESGDRLMVLNEEVNPEDDEVKDKSCDDDKSEYPGRIRRSFDR